jgi:hypothetical protein
VLPGHAESIPGLEFWSVLDHSLADIWAKLPAFNAFRDGDPICRLTPHHAEVAAVPDDVAYAYRRM